MTEKSIAGVTISRKEYLAVLACCALGSLAAIALVLISFLPLLDILHDPVVGLVALTLILTPLVARVDLPLGIPGSLAALVLGSALYYLIHGISGPPPIDAAPP